MTLSRSLRAASAALFVLALGACQSVYFHAINIGVVEGETVAFDPANGLSLDIYRPAGDVRNAPVVVFFYGGSWQTGERGWYRFVGETLSRRGMLVLIPDYRKAPAHPFPDFMQDGARAVAWARAHAGEYGGDPQRLFLMGHSAGAHIAVLLATDKQFLAAQGMRPRDLAGVVGLSGPYDFLPLTDPLVMQALGPSAGWPSTQPVNFIDGDEPPFLLLHGDADTTVRPANSEHLAARLRARGEPVELHMIPGVGHIGMLDGFHSSDASPAVERSVGWIAAQPAPATPGK
ncbi:alpha/beta hydrolase [soil metagenome]